jgi:CheY-like chemotaxis protein
MTKKILVADDSVTIHMIVNLTFAGDDVSVQAVTDGERALDKALEFQPDVILADVDMPGLGGYELCERIKSDPRLAHIPVIILAGSIEPFDEERASRVRCSGHLTKPFATDELIGTVQAVYELKPEIPAPETPAVVAPKISQSKPDTCLVSQRTRESFLGSNRILDVFGILLPPEQPVDSVCETRLERPELEALEETAKTEHEAALESPPEPASAPAPQQTSDGPATEKGEFELSEKTMNAIVDKVLRHLSHEVVREVAWDVVPELAEISIRQWFKENMQKEVAAKTPAPAL